MLTLLRLLSLLGFWETATEDEAEEEQKGEEEEDQDEEVEPIRDPEKQALSREAGKWRKKFREAEARIKELEDAGSGNDGHLRVEAAFWRELVTGERRIGDHESAWDLFTARGFSDLVKLSDEGDVTGMDGALAKLVDRYPWLADEPIESDSDVGVVPGRRTASPPKRNRSGSDPQLSQAELQRRMPHLRKHR